MSWTPRNPKISPRAPRSARTPRSAITPRSQEEISWSKISGTSLSSQWRFLPAESFRLHKPPKKEETLLLEYTAMPPCEGVGHFVPHNGNRATSNGVQPLALPPSRGPTDDEAGGPDLETALMVSRMPRSSGNISPTRRTGRVVLQEAASSFLYDEQNCWFLPFDTKAEIRGLAPSMHVTYNRCVDEEGRSVGAVRLLKSGQIMIDQLSTLGATSAAANLFPSKTCCTFFHERGSRPSGGSVSPKRSRIVRRSRSPRRVTVGHSSLALDDEEIPPWGLGYFCTLQRLQNRPVRLIPRHPDGLRRVLEPDESTIARYSSAEPRSSETLLHSARPSISSHPFRSVFDGHDNRATDDAAAWKSTSSSRRFTRSRYGSQWFIPCQRWRHSLKEGSLTSEAGGGKLNVSGE